MKFMLQIKEGSTSSRLIKLTRIQENTMKYIWSTFNTDCITTPDKAKGLVCYSDTSYPWSHMQIYI